MREYSGVGCWTLQFWASPQSQFGNAGDHCRRVGSVTRFMNEPITILVVDDDPLLVMLLQHKLGVRGYRVLSANDGAKGLDLARSQRPNLIVLDMMMPVLGGRQMLQELRLDPDLAKTPVIMLTALRGERDVVDALQLGAADYLSKPFIPDELIARITRLVPGIQARSL
jgi:DNA-binding response OmpR family regulator